MATEFTLREYPREEYLHDLSEEIKTDGLLKAVEKRCNEIDDYCSPLGYLSHRGVQELLVEILDLIKLKEGKDGMD